MEYIIEFILELIIDGSIELSQNKKVPKIIRYPLIVCIILLFLTVTLGLIVMGVFILKKSVLVGIFISLVGLILLISSIFYFRRKYLDKSKTEWLVLLFSWYNIKYKQNNKWWIESEIIFIISLFNIVSSPKWQGAISSILILYTSTSYFLSL